MQKSTLTTVGAVVSALLASLCCLGPIVLAAVGLGGAGLVATVFEPYRPYLISVTVVLLGVAFFVMYRKKDEACHEGEVCAVPRVRKAQKIGLWIITGGVGLVLAFPYLPWASNTSAPVTSAGPTAVAHLKVNGMDCEACGSGITASLTKLDGIADVRIDYTKGEATVTYTPGKTSPAQVARIITQLGYPTTSVNKPTGQVSDDSRAKLAIVTLRVTGMT